VTRKPKTVLIAAALDTKGEEAFFIKELVEKKRLRGIVIDCGSLDRPFRKGDITRHEVARKGGTPLGELLKTDDKGRIIQGMTDGLRAWVRDLYDEDEIHGIIALGGGQGTAMGTGAMQMLPLGFPKVMVSTIASGNMRPFLQTRDIAVFPSITDVFGINFVFRRILENAVHAVIAMTRNYSPIKKGKAKAVGITAFGTTTAGLKKMKEILNAEGLEVLLFHANGTGGTAMEEMAELGYFDGIMDWSTQEIIAQVGRGIFAPGKERMRIPSQLEIPYLVAPGAIDYITMGPYGQLSRAWQKRNIIIHNRNITLVRATEKEMVRAARFLSRKLNKALGPVKVMIPMKGFCEPNRKGKPFYDPEADGMFIQTLEENLRSDIPIVKVDAHINDVSFVRKGAEQMLQMFS
jgi:uncharacterized protein (UPF0261 family)